MRTRPLQSLPGQARLPTCPPSTAASARVARAEFPAEMDPTDLDTHVGHRLGQPSRVRHSVLEQTVSSLFRKL